MIFKNVKTIGVKLVVKLGVELGVKYKLTYRDENCLVLIIYDFRDNLVQNIFVFNFIGSFR